jgi:hypothetical protein
MDAYGQKIDGADGYDIIDSPTFLYWIPAVTLIGNRVKHPFQGGYKIHVSADAADADRVARAVLPLLQGKTLDHKVVYPLEAYQRLNTTTQRGKFITIYPGPILHSFAALITALDTLLVDQKARPGPQTLDRMANYERPESGIGKSGLLYYVTTSDYQK